MPRTALATSIIAAYLVCSPAHAALDLSDAMQAIGTASVATVVLVPPMAVFRNSLNQAGLQANGCHYTTADPTAIRSLVALLQTAGVATNAVYQRPDIREGAYFTLANGGRFSLLIADNNGGRLPVMGIAEGTDGGQIQSVSVSAKSTLSRDVRGWARRFGGAGSGTACDLQSETAEDPKAPPPLPR